MMGGQTYTTHKINGVKRERANRYDYVSVSHDGATAFICAREGGEPGGYADLTIEGVRKLIAALQSTLAEMEAMQ